MTGMWWLGLWMGCKSPLEDFDPDARRALIIVVDGARIDEFNDPDLLSAVHTELAPLGAVATRALN